MSSPVYTVVNQVKGTFPVTDNKVPVSQLEDFVLDAITAGVTEVHFNCVIGQSSGCPLVVGIEFVKETA